MPALPGRAGERWRRRAISTPSVGRARARARHELAARRGHSAARGRGIEKFVRGKCHRRHNGKSAVGGICVGLRTTPKRVPRFGNYMSAPSATRLWRESSASAAAAINMSPCIAFWRLTMLVACSVPSLLDPSCPSRRRPEISNMLSGSLPRMLHLPFSLYSAPAPLLPSLANERAPAAASGLDASPRHRGGGGGDK